MSTGMYPTLMGDHCNNLASFEVCVRIAVFAKSLSLSPFQLLRFRVILEIRESHTKATTRQYIFAIIVEKEKGDHNLQSRQYFRNKSTRLGRLYCSDPICAMRRDVASDCHAYLSFARRGALRTWTHDADEGV